MFVSNQPRKYTYDLVVLGIRCPAEHNILKIDSTLKLVLKFLRHPIFVVLDFVVLSTLNYIRT